MRAGHALAEAAGWRFWRRRAALLDAGNALAAVATTINNAADEMQRQQNVNKALLKTTMKEGGTRPATTDENHGGVQ